MHTTLEAVYDPETGLQFTEPVRIGKPVRVLITIMDTWSIDQQKKSDKRLLQKLTGIHRMPCTGCRSEAEIEDCIQGNRDNWD
ncbi:MAG: hypothetical protein GY862_33795 [Gammaproteobacteria bacterium]|nr:hypothetical protein [Gammaproteobacteria bacterium]